MDNEAAPRQLAFVDAFSDAAPARTVKGQAAVERILTASIDLLAQEGCAALSMRKVADRLDMRLSALQHHFATWEALLEAMISRVTAQYVSQIDALLAQPNASREKQLRRILDYLFSDIKNPISQSLFAQLWALAQINVFAREAMINTYRRERAMFEFFIRELNPAVPKKEVAQRAAMIATQIEGLMLLMPQQDRFPAELSGMEQVCIAQIIDLVHAPPAAARRRKVP